ncbi:unnamed protein product [Ectocarpus sp. 12 AP-2014]
MALVASDTRSEASGGSGSARSGGSRKYRVVSRGSNVDESLFGSSNSKGRKKSTGRKMLVGEVPPKATVITEEELAQMKRRAIITSLADEEAARVGRENMLEERQRAARARKQRMLEMEVEAKKKALKSDIEVERMAHDQMVKKMATEKLDANNDLVKMLNSLGARAAAFTIRDKQAIELTGLAEKDRREGSEKVYDERMDMIMELDRLKDLTKRDAEEQAKKSKRVEDRKVITEQIEARQRAKLIRLEAREQENRAMLGVIQRYADEDKAAAEKKAIEVRQARAAVMAANEAAIEMRRSARQREVEEVESILAYQAMKDEEMRLREVEEAEKKQMMKERQQKLLEGQLRDMDKQAELDELRARRAAEEKEREMRHRERFAAEKRRKDVTQLQADRKRQADMKKAQLAKEAELEEGEYEAAVRYNATLSERERRESEAKHTACMEHRSAILLQVQEAEAKRKADRAAKFEEGRRLKQEYTTERAKLEAMRDKMVEDMEKRGINPKYLTEMKAVDIHKMHMR